MNNLNTNIIAMAIALTFSGSAMAQNNSPPGASYDQVTSEFTSQYPDSFATIADAGDSVSEPAVQTNSPAAAAANKVATDRIDALYLETKKQCDAHPAAAQSNCLKQMKAGFGR